MNNFAEAEKYDKLVEEKEEIEEYLDTVEINGSTKNTVKEKRKRIEEILNEIINLDIEICLKEQRTKSSQSKYLKEFHHTEKHTLESAIRQKPSRRFYHFQELFCDYRDYRELDDTISLSKENNEIKNIIIHPDKLSIQFLIELWLLDEEFKEKTIEEKNDIKISLIPRIKEILSNTTPLEVSWNNKTTWRILIFWNNSKNLEGKIILINTFQRRVEKNKRTTSKSLTIFDDIYTFYRSQLYTTKSLLEKQTILKKLQSSLLKVIQDYEITFGENWKPEKIIELEEIKELIKKSGSFYEQKAYIDRLEKVIWKNSVQDKNRLRWAYNDLHKQYLSKLSIWENVEKHASIIENLIFQEKIKWKLLEENFKKKIEFLDQEVLHKLIKNWSWEELLEYFTKNRIFFTRINKALKDYCLWRKEICPRPFSQIYNTVKHLSDNLWDNIRNSDLLEILRTIMRINLFLKDSLVMIFLKETENELKLEQRWINPKIANSKINIILKKINIKDFLKDIKFSKESRVDERFRNYNNFLLNIRKLINENKIDEAIKYIESIKK